MDTCSSYPLHREKRYGEYLPDHGWLHYPGQKESYQQQDYPWLANPIEAGPPPADPPGPPPKRSKLDEDRERSTSRIQTQSPGSSQAESGVQS